MSIEKLSVVMPAYLEEENLRVLLPRVKKTLENIGVENEVLVIDTIEGMDNTKQICIENNIRYINREGGNYYGDAIRTGIKYIQGSSVIFMDADGSHSPEYIKKIYQSKNNFDVVIASRYIEGGGSDNNRFLIFMSLIVNTAYSLFLGLGCKDASNGFRLYKADLLKEIKLTCNNFDIIEEIMFKLKRKNKGLKITEIPYLFKERMFGHTKRNLFLFVVSYIFTLIKLRFMK